MQQENATFHCFKLTGKWYETSRGFCPTEVFKPFLGHGKGDSQSNTLQRILKANNGRWPGLSSQGSDFFRIMILDENVDIGYPVFIHPSSNRVG